MPKSKALVPRLRFPEFRNAGPWEVKRLGKIADIYQPETISQSSLSHDGQFLVYGANGIIGRFDRYNHEQPQIAVTCRGSTCGEVTLTRPRSWITGNAMVVNVDNSSEVVKAFLYFQLKGASLDYLITGSGQPQITGEIKKHKVALPSIPEQRKIADCLSSLDELIELESKKLDALKAHKKGLMQQLFPREGETTPRLRFPEFRNAGPWEVKRLGELADIYQPETISQSRLSHDGQFLVYGANGIIGRFDRYNHEHPQIAVTCRGSTCGEVTLTRPRSWITGNSMVVNVDNSPEVIKVFLYFQLKATSWDYLITGSGQPQITGEIKKHKVALPSFPEQQKIADCLSSLDELIELESKKLDALKAHKKWLMQQLFPQEFET